MTAVHNALTPNETADIISVLQQNRLQWYGHVLRKEDNDWVKKCMEYEVEGARPRGRPKKTRRDCGKRLSGVWIEQGGYMDP